MLREHLCSICLQQHPLIGTAGHYIVRSVMGRLTAASLAPHCSIRVYSTGPPYY